MFCKNITCMTSSCRAVKAARLWRSRSCRQTQQKRRNCQYFHSENLRLCWSKKTCDPWQKITVSFDAKSNEGRSRLDFLPRSKRWTCCRLGGHQLTVAAAWLSIYDIINNLLRLLKATKWTRSRIINRIECVDSTHHGFALTTQCGPRWHKKLLREKLWKT